MKVIRFCEVERRRRNMTQKQLAEAVSDEMMSVHQVTISLLERGAEFSSRPEVLRRIAVCFGWPEEKSTRLLEPIG